MNNNIKSILALTGLVLCTFTLMAQGPPGGPGTGGPIDGGATALLAGAAYVGYKKLKARRQEREAAKEKGE